MKQPHPLPIARRACAVQMPIIPHIANLIQSHPGTISLGQGVVHYGPPPSAMESISRFAQDASNHKYKAGQGLSILLDELRVKLARDNNVTITSHHTLMVTAGSNMAYTYAVSAITDPGDEIILLTPYYFNHEMAHTIANVTTVSVATDDNYQPRIDLIEQAITPRTKAVVTISPNNPTGAVYSEATLREINTLCRERGLYHIHDEAYEYFVFDGAQHFSPASLPHSAAHTISLFSFSKTFGMASWRVGYLVAPAHLNDSLRKIQDTVLICPPVITQYAACGALAAGRAYAATFLAGYDAVRKQVRTLLAPLGDKIFVPPTKGSLYFYLRVKTTTDALTLAEQLIREQGVAVIPGTTFGIRDQCCLRLSYGALNATTVREGMQRLISGLEKLA